MVQCLSHLDIQLTNDLTRVRKPIRSIGSSDPKLLAAIAKVETDEDLKSDFDAMAYYILPCDHVANKNLTRVRMRNTICLIHQLCQW